MKKKFWRETQENNMATAEPVADETSNAVAEADAKNEAVTSEKTHEKDESPTDQDQQEKEGEHAQLLRNALDRTINKCLSSAKWVATPLLLMFTCAPKP